MKRAILASVVVMGFLLLLTPAFAASLPPGSANVPVPTIGSNPFSGDTLVATVSGTYDYNTPPGSCVSPNCKDVTGNYLERVYTDTNGELVFGFQVTNDATSAGIVERLTSGQWGSTDIYNFGQWVGAGPDWFVGTTKFSGASNQAGIVGGDLRSPTLAAGKNSYVLVLFTHSKSLKPGTLSVQDGATQTKDAVVPSPEPASLSLLAFGLAGLGALRKKRQ